MNTRVVLLFLVLFMILALHLPVGMIAGLGFQPNILIAGLVAVVLTSFLAERSMGLVILVVTLTLLANFPVEDYIALGFDRDVVITVLILLVLTPIVYRFFDD